MNARVSIAGYRLDGTLTRTSLAVEVALLQRSDSRHSAPT
jgi:hypothetical protein